MFSVKIKINVLKINDGKYSLTEKTFAVIE